MSEIMQPSEISNYIDLTTGLSRVRNNKKLFNRMLGLLLSSDEFQKFEDALAAQDYNAAADVAHAIKGMTGNLSVDKLFNISTTLMTELRNGIVDEAHLAEYRDTLEKSLAAVKAQIAIFEAELG